MRRSIVLGSAILLTGLLGVTAAAADPAQGGAGSAFGGSVSIGGEEVLAPTPVAEVSGIGDDADETLLEVPADPLVFSGTLNAEAHIHEDADLESFLEHDVEGPYNAQALGQVEDLEVLIDAIETDVPLVNASLVTGEVVAKCVGDAVEYSATSEIVDLDVAGDEQLGDALNDLLNELFDGLEPLQPILDIDQNVITELDGGGLAVDALVITIFDAAAPEEGVVRATFGHAELSDVTCGAAVAPPECSDEADNDDDGVIDADDPGCHTDGDPDNPDSYDPDDDDETDEGDAPDCSDGVDNDGDGVSDTDDPGCHVDGDATNPDSYDPNDDDETDTPVQDAGALPRTGATVPLAGAAVLALGALALHALQRRAA